MHDTDGIQFAEIQVLGLRIHVPAGICTCLQPEHLLPAALDPSGEPMTFTGFTEYWLANGLFRFRIPMLFIILPGTFFARSDDRPYKQRSGKRVRTLLYPYLFWSAFGLALSFLLECFPYSRNIVAETHMMQIDESRVFLHQYQWYEVLARWVFFPFPTSSGSSGCCWSITWPTPSFAGASRTVWLNRYLFSVAVFMWLSTFGIILIEGEGLLFFSLGIWMQKSHFNIEVPNKWMNLKVWGILFLGLSLFKTWLAFQPGFPGVEHVLLFLHKLVVLSGLVFRLVRV